MKNDMAVKLASLPGPVLITGHTGFKGAWLTLLLRQMGVEVVGVSLAPLENSLYRKIASCCDVPSEFIDIRNYDEVSRVLKKFNPSVIFHLAAQSLVLDSYQFPRETFETNVMGTVNLLEAGFKLDSLRAVLVATTDKVYRNDGSGIKFHEGDMLQGKDPYSASKVATESVVNSWNQISSTTGGPSVVSLRAGNVIGGGDLANNRLLPDLIRGFSTGEIVNVRNPDSTRPWQYVLDPLYGYLLAMASTLESSTFTAINFGPQEGNLTVSEVVNIAAETWGNIGGVRFLESDDSTLTEATKLDLNSEFAHKSLNWKPRVSQSQAVIETVSWWKKVLSNEISPADACNASIASFLSINT
jgi:CDP-glucose 4,6-dehydratase